MELEVTRDRVLRIWWAWAWRNFLLLIAGLVIEFIISFILAVLLSMAGISPAARFIVTLPIGFIIGLGAVLFSLKMVLTKDFGDFRLVLLAQGPMGGAPVNAPSPSAEPTGNVYVRPDSQ